jgi:hypothetical protein
LAVQEPPAQKEEAQAASPEQAWPLARKPHVPSMQTNETQSVSLEQDWPSGRRPHVPSMQTFETQTSAVVQGCPSASGPPQIPLEQSCEEHCWDSVHKEPFGCVARHTSDASEHHPDEHS